MPDPVACLLVYLLIGSLLWMATDPLADIDAALWASVQRRGRLPGGLIIAIAIMVTIVLWPRIVIGAFVKVIRSVR